MLKQIAIVTALISAASFAETRVYRVTCEGTQIRQPGETRKVNARFDLSGIKGDENQISIFRFVGHVAVLDSDKASTSDYYSVFGGKEISSNTKYNPRTYKNHFQIKGLSDIADNGVDGGGMNGDFLLSKDVLAENVTSFKAHFVFQSGDHIGGTIDFSCVRE